MGAWEIERTSDTDAVTGTPSGCSGVRSTELPGCWWRASGRGSVCGAEARNFCVSQCVGLATLRHVVAGTTNIVSRCGDCSTHSRKCARRSPRRLMTNEVWVDSLTGSTTAHLVQEIAAAGVQVLLTDSSRLGWFATSDARAWGGSVDDRI